MNKPSDLEEIEFKAQAKQVMNVLKLASGEMSNEQYKKEQTILSDGLSALSSLFEEIEATRSPRKFAEFADKHGITLLNKDWVADEISRGDKDFVLYADRKQTGYNARHISSIINGLREKGSEVIVVDLPRNRRKVFGEKSVLEKEVEAR
jgi:hypothetical protein